MITAPSTIGRSPAPSDIRLPPPALHHAGDGEQHGQWNDHGGDQRGAQIAEQQNNFTAITSNAFQQIGLDGGNGFSTSTLRSYTVVAVRPSGSERLISSILAEARLETSRLFSPMSMNTVPSTISSPFMVAAPVRRSLPSDTSAISLMVMGAPACLLTTMRRMSSSVCT
jgi:hypothetical protein